MDMKPATGSFPAVTAEDAAAYVRDELDASLRAQKRRDRIDALGIVGAGLLGAIPLVLLAVYWVGGSW